MKTSIELHPSYSAMQDTWQKMRDCQSQRLVKAADDSINNISTSVKKYLPKTGGQSKDIAKGEESYQAKKIRAEYPSNLIDTERQMLGLLAKNTLTINIPDNLSKINEIQANITEDNEDIEALNARINEQQVITSRVGMLWDLPPYETREASPYVVLYPAERIVNWHASGNDDKYRFVVIDISDYEVDTVSGKWELVDKYKVLNLDTNGYYYTYEHSGDAGSIDLSLPPENSIYPTINGKKCNEIPFIICNASTVSSCVENPILEALADSCLKYYRNDADYQELIYMQTIAILYMTGITSSDIDRMKEISVKESFASTSESAQIGFAEVSGAGLSESRLNLENSKNDMINRGVAIMEAGAGESGEALSIRLTTKTANLSTIADTSALALQKMLRIMARWLGLADNEIVINSNNDFTDKTVNADDLVKMSALVIQGSYTREDFFNELKRAGKTKFETFEEWNVNTESTNMGLSM